MDFERWEIVDNNVKYLERNCIKISGNPTLYSGNKHNIESFNMLIDGETGILLRFEGFKNGKISNYIIATELSLDDNNSIKNFNPQEYNEFNEVSRLGN